MGLNKDYTQLDLMQARIRSVPDGWSFDYVGKTFAIRNNLRKPLSEYEREKTPGPYPYYGPTKIQGYIGTFEQNGSYALIGEDGDHFLKYKDKSMTQLVNGKCTVNNHAHIIEGTNKATREWFYNYFMHRDIFSFLSRQGAGRFKLNKASLEKIPLLVPPLPEQKKIAQILSTWDQAITTTEQLLANSQQQKKALMQQLLTGKKRLLDEKGVRFGREWYPTKIKDIFKNKTEVAGQKSHIVYSVTKAGLISQIDYFNKSVASDDTSNYKVIRTGDFVMSGLNFWMGAVDVYTESEAVMVSPAYKVFQINGAFDTGFIRQLVRSNVFLRVLEGSSIVGASIVRRNFSDTIFKNWILSLPSLPEQLKIGTVLSSADREIKILQQKLDCLKQEKKALMQQLLTGKRRVHLEAENV